MTDAYVSRTIKTLLHESHVRRAVEGTLGDMIQALEQYTHESEREKVQHELEQLKGKLCEESAKVQELENTNKKLQTHRAEIRQKANQAKEHFIVDISQVLRESRNIFSLRERLKEMDKRLLLTARLEAELVEAKKRIKELEKQNQPGKRQQRSTSIGSGSKSAIAAAAAVKIPCNLLVNINDSFLMNAFSYLSTKDVIYTAQSCRYLYKKVDSLFSIGSALCKPEWAILPSYYKSQQSQQSTSDPGASTNIAASSIPNRKEVVGGSGNPGSGIIGLTKQMAEDLSKKLSAPELKTILSMMDNQKKLSTQLQTSQSEHAQMKEKLESTESARDFLIGKLKDAEFAIKSAMAEQMTLQKQADTDHDVIFYLDNQSKILESENKELRWKCGQLEASLDLLRGSHNLNAKQTLEELHEIKDRLEVSETSAKSQKKILVKEVKTLRSQLDTVREERDNFARKLQILKDTLASTEVNGSFNNDKGPSQVKAIANKVYSMKNSLFK